MSVVVLVVLMGALYAFMILPQQKRMKAHQQLVNSLAEGDLVVTNSGIYGAIAEVEGDVIWLEVAPDVELKLSRAAVAERVSDDDDDGDDADDDSLVEADSDDGDA
ncbi:MAG: preprotein translocase subunit YajC [Acidimicrobiales bacterium]